MRYNPPPNWPKPPKGWVPHADWSPDPSWPPPPQGWRLWVEEEDGAEAPSALGGLKQAGDDGEYFGDENAWADDAGPAPGAGGWSDVDAAVRQVIGGSDMDTILSSHGSDVVGETKKLLQQTLDTYAVGLTVNEINFQNLLPPHEVKEAFDDVNHLAVHQSGSRGWTERGDPHGDHRRLGA